MASPLRLMDLGPIIQPFHDAGAGVEVIVQDADGRVLAGAGSGSAPRLPVPAPASANREIVAAGAVVGRVVVRGVAAPLVEALAASLGATLEALVEASLARSAGADQEDHRLEAELALARRIQRSFVPLTVPDIQGYEVASQYEAAREVGGDFFDVFRPRGRAGRLAIVVADVTGKGIAAALLMAFARPLLHAAIDHARDPVEALRRTNRILVEERRSSLFITALCAIVELRSGRIRIANAGHEPPLIVPANGAPIRPLEGSGPLLGAFATLDLDECTDELGPGDLALFYTDGVTDSRADTGERFGDERLLALLDGSRGRTARELVDALAGAVADFQGAMPAADDLTVVAIRRNEPRRRRLRQLV